MHAFLCTSKESAPTGAPVCTSVTVSVTFLRCVNFRYDRQPSLVCATGEESQGPHVTGDRPHITEFHPECLMGFHSDFFQ